MCSAGIALWAAVAGSSFLSNSCSSLHTRMSLCKLFIMPACPYLSWPYPLCVCRDISIQTLHPCLGSAALMASWCLVRLLPASACITSTWCDTRSIDCVYTPCLCIPCAVVSLRDDVLRRVHRTVCFRGYILVNAVPIYLIYQPAVLTGLGCCLAHNVGRVVQHMRPRFSVGHMSCAPGGYCSAWTDGPAPR